MPKYFIGFEMVYRPYAPEIQAMFSGQTPDIVLGYGIAAFDDSDIDKARKHVARLIGGIRPQLPKSYSRKHSSIKIWTSVYESVLDLAEEIGERGYLDYLEDLGLIDMGEWKTARQLIDSQ